MDDREGGEELDGQAAPHWLLGVLGGPGLSCCVGKLLLTAGPVGALCLPLFPKFSHEQKQSHCYKEDSQNGKDHSDGYNSP